MREDLRSFINRADLHALQFWQSRFRAGTLGEDFWLTRNRYGTGFAYRFFTGDGEAYGHLLADAAHDSGESDLVVGDDGCLYTY